MSNALLEAMACGLDVIATRVSGVAELVENEGTGLLADPGSPDSLRAAIQTLLGAEPGRFGAEARRVIVGPRQALATRRIPVSDINWIGEGAFADAPEGGWEATVKVRSTRPPAPARIHPRGDGGAEVELLSPEEGVAPGQACVFYAPEGSRVLGGGWIGRA